jgi:hypothetical protein
MFKPSAKSNGSTGSGTDRGNLSARSRVRIGTGALARAGANGTKLGRRRVDPKVEAKILELKASGDGILKIGRKLGIGTSVVQRFQARAGAILIQCQRPHTMPGRCCRNPQGFGC